MKTRTSFVANSSSSSFVITSTSGAKKTMRDFVEENKDLAEEFVKRYGPTLKVAAAITPESLVESFEKNLQWYDKPFVRKQATVSFGDEDYTVIGEVFDYMLRERTSSKSFKWYMYECRGAEFNEDGKQITDKQGIK